MNIKLRRLWHRVAPVELQMWAHRKADYDWRPSKLVADRLPWSIVYWTYLRVGAKLIQSNETVPEVPYTTILQRIPVKKG